jgi:thiamine biosynthesis lipoprotein
LRTALLLLILALGSGGPPIASEHDRVFEREAVLMGTRLSITITADNREMGLAASEQVILAIEAAEARLSTWHEDTELVRLNSQPVNEPLLLSPKLTADLSRAKACWRQTAGAFDPNIARLVKAWGLRSVGRVPSEAMRLEAMASRGLDGLELNGRWALKTDAALEIEEGGFGKGVALDDAIQALMDSGITQARLDLGGQVILHGYHDRTEVVIATPRHRDTAALALTVTSGSVATSGNSEHGITIDSTTYGHLLDPRTGLPVDDFGSLTVWAADATTADCLSTGLYILGPERALNWAERHPGIEVLIIEPVDDGMLQARVSSGLTGRVRLLNNMIVLSPTGSTPGSSN